MKKVYAVRIKEVYEETLLVEADSISDAVEKVEDVYHEGGIDCLDLSDVVICRSEASNFDGEATEMQKEFCRWIYVEEEEQE